MDPEELKARLRTGEDSRTEYKSVRAGKTSPDAITKETTAFANSGGGEIFFGVEDDGSVSGVGTPKDAEQLQRHIAQANRDAVVPPLRVELRTVEVDGMLVVLARVPAYLPGRPFRGKSKYFVRDGPISREATPEELRRVLTSASDHHYEEETVSNATVADFDEDAVLEYVEALRRVNPRASLTKREAYLVAAGALSDEGEPTVAGILLFGAEPQRFITDAYISAVSFAGRTMGRDFLDRREIQGTLVQQLDEAVSFLERNVSRPARIVGTRRIDWMIPEEVWREAVTNALTHRDYAVTTQTRIYVFEDRVEIANPGILLNRLTIDRIRIGRVTQRRNRHIAAAFKNLGIAEGIGLGVAEVFKLVQEAGYPEPEIQIDHGEFRLTIFTQPLEEPSG